MSEVFFPSLDEILLIHGEVIKETCGSEGLRDSGALESALRAEENRLFYGPPDLALLGATYAYHLSQAHAFFVGNKHIAPVTSELFLEMIGAKSNPTNKQIIELFLEIAASRLSREEVEQKFAEWLVKEENE